MTVHCVVVPKPLTDALSNRPSKPMRQCRCESVHMGGGGGRRASHRTGQPSVDNLLETIMITNMLNAPFRRRRSVIWVTAVALGSTAIGYGFVGMPHHPSPPSRESTAIAPEWRPVSSEAPSSATDGPWHPSPDASCSGGANGGMDATGNQCSDPHSAISYASDEAATSPATLAAPGASMPGAANVAAAAAMCSGGADGGMDATGNECSDSSPADTTVRTVRAYVGAPMAAR